MKTSHNVLEVDSEVNEARNLIHATFPQAFGLLSAMIEGPDET